jgi:GntR family transcriptional repressor for pyruvate dehydrogenase complex
MNVRANFAGFHDNTARARSAPCDGSLGNLPPDRVKEGGLDLEKIRRSRLSDAVVDRIKGMIERGELKPGDKLPSEKELAEAFGVSRMSIREALSMLSASQIIEIRHGEGSFVQRMEVSNYIPPIAVSLLDFPAAALHLLEVRTMLAVGAAELAAMRADADALAEMDAALSAYWDEVREHGTGAKSDWQFHHAIVRATKNPVLVEFANRIADLVAEGMRYTLGKNVGDSERIRQVAAEHEQIAAAIRARDAAAAGTAMRQHLEHVRQKLMRLMEEQKLETAQVEIPADTAAPVGKRAEGVTRSGQIAGNRQSGHTVKVIGQLADHLDE